MPDEFDAPMELGAALQVALKSRRPEIRLRVPPMGSGRVFMSSLQDPTNFEPAAFIPTFLCRYCQNWYPASSLIKFGDGLERCEKCQERHNAALEALAGNPPKECGMCQITFEWLQDQTPGDLVRMRVIMVDGTYVLACDPCYDAFVQASRELYKGTRFGAQRKL